MLLLAFIASFRFNFVFKLSDVSIMPEDVEILVNKWFHELSYL